MFAPPASQSPKSKYTSRVCVPASFGSPRSAQCSRLPTPYSQRIRAALGESWVCPGGCQEHNQFVTELEGLQWFPVLIKSDPRSSESLALGWFSCISYDLEASIYHFPYLVFQRYFSLHPAVSINKVSGNLSSLLISLLFQYQATGLIKSCPVEVCEGLGAQVHPCRPCPPFCLRAGGTYAATGTGGTAKVGLVPSAHGLGH